MTLPRRQLALIVAGLGVVCSGAELPKTAGAIVGVVADPGGISQMGATVMLFNRFEKLVMKTLTNPKGEFGFDDLVPDQYMIRVSLPAFVPAVRQGILVQPGMRSFLSIHLASVLSSVEFVYASPNPRQLLTDEWRWALRSAMSTRPVLRFLPGPKPGESLFSNTRGLVKVSAGDGANAQVGGQPDLGTAFAVATSLYGVNNVQVAGNVGYVSRTGLPVASFRTRYSRDFLDNGLASSSSPVVQLTVRQTFLPGRAGAAQTNSPSFGSMSGLVIDHAKIGDDIEFTYGAQLESVAFFDRVNLLSPFARADVKLTTRDSVQVAWSSGAAPEEFYLSARATDGDLQNGLATLSAFPRVSMRNGHTHVQRMEQGEVTLAHQFDPKTRVSASAFYESVANAALMAAGDTGIYSTSEMLPDLFTNASIFNIGSYSRRGAMVALERQFANHWSAQASFGHGGTLQTRGDIVNSNDPDALRSALRKTDRSWISARVSGALPYTGTRIIGSYLFTDYRAALPAHRYMTQRTSPDLGLNVQLRQPITNFGLWTGRVEAIAELRNLLQQGYLPVNGPNGRRVLLVPSPRSVRGGLAFIF